MATFTEHLRARGEEGVAALLAERPDLAAPPPASLRALAARAANRMSLDRTLGAVDAAVLHVLETVLALHGTAGRSAVTLADVVAVGGADPDDAARAATAALRLALLWTPEDRAGVPAPATPATRLLPAPGLDDVLGPYPAGLGPTLRGALARRSAQGLTRLVADLGLGAGGDAAPDAEGERDAALDLLADHLAAPATVAALLERAPSGARSVLEALTWGPPVGRSPVPPPGQEAGPGRTAVEWLLRHGLLSVGDPQHVVLPREVALALRGGRTHREPPVAPDPTPGAVDARTVDAESAQHALEVVRLVGALLDAWGAEPPPVLRAGGLGTRELRRVATRLELDDARAALVVEVAGAAGLVVDDGEEPASVAPTADADDWLRRPAPDRWEHLVTAWFASERAAWLVGTRDDRGTVRPALDPEARRPWAPRLRRTVLEVLAGAAGASEAGTTLASLTAAQVHEVLVWRAPRSAPPLHAVEAVLAEAGALGVLGAGALAPAGAALLGGEQTPARALADRLPPAVDDLLLQGDLTGIVPGRPSDALADLVESAAQVESRGAALTVRFTEASVRRALDRGRTAEELLAALSQAARNGVPQPLEYLVLDVARRHGRVRVGMASSYLRADDPALLAGLVEDKALRGLGLLLVAPTVIASQAPPSVLLAALRERGLAPVTEDSTGAVVVVGPSVTRVRGRGRRRPSGPSPRTPAVTADDARDRRLRRVAKDVLAADRREATAATQAQDAEVIAARAGGPPGGAPGSAQDADQGTPDPVLALALLREAVAEGREVWLDIVGPDGGSSRRRVRPVRVDAGRVRAIDPEREAELTVAVHRIAGVTPTGGDR